MSEERTEPSTLDRRAFFRVGGAGAALLAGCAHTGPRDPAADPPRPPPTRERVLGRTGFRVPEISIGTGRLSDANVIRYAYDRGVRLFDTAEAYGNGDSERKIGEAMKHLDRDRIFLVTKLKIGLKETEESILRRFGQCLERLQTPYVNALYSHSVTDLRIVTHAGFHAAVRRLKADGKLRHAGISSHGPRGGKGDSMEQVHLAAVEDGRYDMQLLVYNFMNPGPGARILSAAQKRNVGTALMKTSPGRLRIAPLDPAHPSEEHERMLRRMVAGGATRPQALAKLAQMLAHEVRERKTHGERFDAFVREHGITADRQLREKAILWAKENGNAGTVLVSMPDFEAVDRFVPLTGRRLTAREAALLRSYADLRGAEYCRHGCADCSGACPHDVPVSTIMRYAYYFGQGRERDAIDKYAALPERVAEACLGCSAPCAGACPHGVRIQAQVASAHGLLSVA